MSPDAPLPHLDVGSGSPVLLLHGFGLDARMWSAQVEALRRSHRVIAPDLPGFGPAGASAGSWSAAEETLRLLERKQIEPVHLVGLSRGGAVATDLVLSAPDRVRSLVLIDALLLGERTGIGGWKTAVDRAKAGDLAGARAAWLGSDAFVHLGPEARELTRAMVDDYRCGHWCGTVESRWQKNEHRPLLPGVHQPTLVLVGGLDLPEFQTMARTYAETIPGARLVELDGVGHMGPMEAPERVNALLEAFYLEHDAPVRLPESARLTFRTWRDDDLHLALQLWGDERVTALISRQPWDRPQVEERLRSEIERQKAHGLQYWPAFLRETGELVGCCGLVPRDGEEGVVVIGFHLRPEFWGQGIASEVARAVVQHAFGTLGVKGVFAGHHPENGASRRILERLGFRHTHHELYPPTGLKHPCYLLLPGAWPTPRSPAERSGDI